MRAPGGSTHITYSQVGDDLNITLPHAAHVQLTVHDQMYAVQTEQQSEFRNIKNLTVSAFALGAMVRNAARIDRVNFDW